MPAIMINGAMRMYDRGTTYEQIVREYQPKYHNQIALVYFNGKMCELCRRAERDGVLTFITTGDSAGHNAYVRTAQMMLVKAVSDVIGDRTRVRTKIEFTLGNALYCSIIGSIRVTEEFARKVGERMREIAGANHPIRKKIYPLDDAIELFRHQDMPDKVKLFHFRRSSTVNTYELDGFYDYFYGYMLPSTGYCRLFDVQAYEQGLLLILPTTENPSQVEPFVDQKSLYQQLMLSTQWGKLVDISTVADLNEKICSGSISDMILVQEALQERRIGEISRQIDERQKVKFVLVAGPSSSGKTTFAHRLAIQLQSFGFRPHIISMDNYFVDRAQTPVDEDGNYNYDVIEALDLELFNENMVDLLNGETVEMPSFNFKAGKRVYRGQYMKLEANDVLIIEGIHGLNPLTTADLPEENKFRIYISALTSLNIDEHNRIPSTDARLLRRMVRDARTRGSNAQETLAGWKKVREGEEKNIFPFQESADAVFNSTLIYELAVLKQYAEPLLFNVQPQEPEYYEAKRLLKFLDYFVGVDTAPVPTNSLCREFVGGGCFGL